MIKTYFMSARHLVASCAVATLAGCAAMDAGMMHLAESNQTPESMGISTANYRGWSCSMLKGTAERMRESQPSQTPFTAKAFGWHIDAIEQVQREQHCADQGQDTANPTPTLPTMYGVCSQLSGRSDSYLSNVFVYSDWGANHGEPEKAQFNEFLQRYYHIADPTGSCSAEDSQAKATALRERYSKVGQFNLSIKTIDVAWTPSTVAPAVSAPRASSSPQPAPAAAQPRAIDATVVSVGGLRASVSTLAPGTGKALGLPEASSGVMVVQSPSANGLKPLDVIVEIAGQPVESAAELSAVVNRMRVGYKAPVRVWRDRSLQELVISVAAQP